MRKYVSQWQEKVYKQFSAWVYSFWCTTKTANVTLCLDFNPYQCGSVTGRQVCTNQCDVRLCSVDQRLEESRETVKCVAVNLCVKL